MASLKIPCSDSTALGHEQIGLELTAERLGPNGVRRSQAAGSALAFGVQTEAYSHEHVSTRPAIFLLEF